MLGECLALFRFSYHSPIVYSGGAGGGQLDHVGRERSTEDSARFRNGPVAAQLCHARRRINRAQDWPSRSCCNRGHSLHRCLCWLPSSPYVDLRCSATASNATPPTDLLRGSDRNSCSCCCAIRCPHTVIFPAVYYLQRRVREGLKSPGFAESYCNYLTIRGQAGEDPLLPNSAGGSA